MCGNVFTGSNVTEAFHLLAVPILLATPFVVLLVVAMTLFHSAALDRCMRQ